MNSGLTPAFERIRERHRRGSRLERLWLALMRRPGCEPDEIEGRAQTPVRIGEALRVDGGGPQENFATQRFAATRMQRVRAAHSAEAGENREYIRITDDRAIEIDDWQRQARALRKAPESAHVDKGGDSRRRAAKNLALRDGQALSQFGQRLAPNDRRDQETVALQRAPHLDQGARQIVHRLQSEQRDGKIEAPVGDRKALEVADGRQKTAGSQARLGRGETNDAINLAPSREHGRAMRAG